jgi:hypothetical protein
LLDAYGVNLEIEIISAGRCSSVSAIVCDRSPSSSECKCRTVV